MNKDFALFMSQLKETNQTLDFFCDFDKISANVADVEMSLNTLNYLIGREDLSKGVKDIWLRDPKVFEVLGILIAVRDEGKKPVVDGDGNVVGANTMRTSVLMPLGAMKVKFMLPMSW